ncbi:MAG: thioredoxin domain-containing protein, partial [Cyanobacteria bacterium]|nr:thioredoxin domain-containing protein [Cyanobacteria bacterium CG_2015-02_32_10]
MTQNPNSLINETSPYLLQHAYNPVNWLPWNDESLEKAKNENKMILVSIGYSACHWCHVMEHESFEDEAVAKLMNQYFVCIKVDREEHPDVDHFYMEAVQLLSGRGGWPLNCFALPDGRPVWGGTYFRKYQWISVLQQLQELFETQKNDLEEQARKLAEGIQQSQFSSGVVVKETNTEATFIKAAKALKNHLDNEQGGTRGTPKFPMPDLLMLEFELSAQLKDRTLENHALLTLEKMARGGIYDQIGGGFARYSVDARWHVPHFEKMLYDNAQLIGLYTEAWR